VWSAWDSDVINIYDENDIDELEYNIFERLM
jgi:hypothetical protein